MPKAISNTETKLNSKPIKTDVRVLLKMSHYPKYVLHDLLLHVCDKIFGCIVFNFDILLLQITFIIRSFTSELFMKSRGQMDWFDLLELPYFMGPLKPHA